MYKNQLQELAQRSCFNLPSYTCTREGPDHAPRFKATVNFNGEMFECPDYCSTLRQAEHSAAEVALKSLSTRGPSLGLAARILDETGVYKNLLQEISQRVGAPLPQYTSYRSGPRHQPVFTGTVELAGITFTGEPAKNKKQAEKNAALAAWSSLKQLAKETASSSSDAENNDELDQVTIARALLKYRIKERKALENASGPVQFNKKFPLPNPRPSISRPLPATFSKILPLICQRTPCNRPTTSRARPSLNDYSMQSIPLSEMDPSGDHYGSIPQSSSVESCGNHNFPPSQPSGTESFRLCPTSSAQSFKIKYHEAQTQRFPAAEAAPYVPLRSYRRPCHGIAPAVTLRTAVLVFSAPPLPPPSRLPSDVIQGSAVRIALPVCVKQAVSTCAAPSFWKEDPLVKARNDPLSNQKENNHASRKEPLKVQKEGPFNAVLSIAEIPTQETESMAAKKSKKESLMESPPSVSFAKFPAEKNDHAILWKYNETKTEGTSATESITATESQESETRNPALEPSLTELSTKETDATRNLNEAEMLQNLEQLQI